MADDLLSKYNGSEIDTAEHTENIVFTRAGIESGYNEILQEMTQDQIDGDEDAL